MECLSLTRHNLTRNEYQTRKARKTLAPRPKAKLSMDYLSLIQSILRYTLQQKSNKNLHFKNDFTVIQNPLRKVWDTYNMRNTSTKTAFIYINGLCVDLSPACYWLHTGPNINCISTDFMPIKHYLMLDENLQRHALRSHINNDMGYRYIEKN